MSLFFTLSLGTRWLFKAPRPGCIAQKPCVGCGPGADASELHSKLLCPSALHLTLHLDSGNTEMNQTQSSSRKAWLPEYSRHSNTIERSG